jgi:hypothetical protein
VATRSEGEDSEKDEVREAGERAHLVGRVSSRPRLWLRFWVNRGSLKK